MIVLNTIIYNSSGGCEKVHGHKVLVRHLQLQSPKDLLYRLKSYDPT